MTARIGNLPLPQSLVGLPDEFPVEEASISFSAGAIARGRKFGNCFSRLALGLRGRPVGRSTAG